MARSRVIKPEFWTDEKIGEIPRDSKLLFIGLWCLSDDYGVVRASEKYIKGQLFPYDDCLSSDVGIWLRALENKGLIIKFASNGESYYYIRTFRDHQKIHNPSKSRNPEPPKNILGKNRRKSEEIEDVRVETETETETETEYKQNTTLSGEQEAARPTACADLDEFAFAEQGFAIKGDVASTMEPPNGSDPPQDDTVHKREMYKGRIIEIVDYLNQRVGASYKHDTPDTVKLITARLKQGFTVEDFRTVIDKKTAKWKSDPKMQAFLRPPTLFSTKFESYLNEPEGGLNGHTRGGKQPLAFEAEKPRGKYADVEKFTYTDHWPVAGGV